MDGERRAILFSGKFTPGAPGTLLGKEVGLGTVGDLEVTIEGGVGRRRAKGEKVPGKRAVPPLQGRTASLKNEDL